MIKGVHSLLEGAMLSIETSAAAYASMLFFAGFDYPNKWLEISSCNGRGIAAVWVADSWREAAFEWHTPRNQKRYLLASLTL